MRPNRLLVLGFLGVLAGAVLPFLMVIGLLPGSLWLSFLSYIVSITGLFLGILGAAGLVANRRARGEDGGGEPE